MKSFNFTDLSNNCLFAATTDEQMLLELPHTLQMLVGVLYSFWIQMYTQ